MRISKQNISKILRLIKTEQIYILKIYFPECTLEELQEMVSLMCEAWTKISQNSGKNFISKYDGTARKIVIEYNNDTKVFLPYFNLLFIPRANSPFIGFNIIKLLLINFIKSIGLNKIPVIKFDTKAFNKDFEKVITEFFKMKTCLNVEPLSDDEKYFLHETLKNHRLSSLHGNIRKIYLEESIER